MSAIDSYAWPGNVRELENRIKRAVIMADGRSIGGRRTRPARSQAGRRSRSRSTSGRPRSRRPPRDPPGDEPHREQHLRRRQAARDQPADAVRPAQAISSASVADPSTSGIAASATGRYRPRRFACWGAVSWTAAHFLSTAGAAAVLPVPLTSLPFAPALAQAAPAGAGDAALNQTFERIFQEQVRTSPTFATVLGLDKGELAPLRSQLDTRPIAQARREEAARTDKFIGWLEAVPEAGLSQSRRAQPRSRPVGPQDQQCRAQALRHLQPAKPVLRSASRTAPISRSPISCTARTRSKMRPTRRPILSRLDAIRDGSRQ